MSASLNPSRPRTLPTGGNPRSVCRLLELVAQGLRSTRAVQEALGADARAVQTLVHAARWLGLVEPDGDAQLTTLGLELVYAGTRRSRVWARAVWQTPFVELLMAGRAGGPGDDELRGAIARAEPDLDADAVGERVAALRGLVGATLDRPRPKALDHDAQLALPLAARPTRKPIVRLAVAAGKEYDPDVYRYLLGALLDHGELTLGQIRALLDRAQVTDAPIGGYVDLAVARGDGARVEERLVASRGLCARVELVETTTSIVLSDPGWRAWLAESRAAAAGDRQAEIRRDKQRARFRAWDRRVFGREHDPARVDADLRRVLLDRSLDAFPLAAGPGSVAPAVREPFLDAWERDDLAVAAPPTLALLAEGLDAVNDALKGARSGRDVAPPDLAARPVAVHGGLLHPGEPLPRAIPDVRSLRLRLVMHAPYAALVTALLLLHRRQPGELDVVARRGGWRVRRRDEDVGDLLEVADAFGRDRGWSVVRRRQGGLSSAHLVATLEAVGVATVLAARVVLAERFFAQMRAEVEEAEVGRRLDGLAEALAGHLGAALPTLTAPAA